VPLQRFGGDWTEDKLSRVEEYLRAYLVALKKERFKLEYIDAFAGTGYREALDPARPGELWFPAIAEPEVQSFLDGSARRALKIKDGFSRFTFIEKDPRKVQELEALREEFPEADIRIERGDANEKVQMLCRESWDGRRAVLFLDPFGLQVSWRTLEAVARTKAIDTWLLFPLGVGVSRLLPRDGALEETTLRRLDFLFGDRSWHEAFYRPRTPVRRRERQHELFEDIEEQHADSDNIWKADFAAIEEYFKSRLRSIFAGVADNPVRLKNSKNNPLYLLFFMAGNENGTPIAIRMAEWIMRQS
jgi:three-Cys-motif partner protein